MGQLEGAVTQLASALQASDARALAAEQALAGAQATTTVPAARAGNVVDTRVLGRPPSFDGRTATWRGWEFWYLAYCGAVEPRLKDLLMQCEAAPLSDLENVNLDVQGVRLSM